jgi:hypothetical protein
MTDTKHQPFSTRQYTWLASVWRDIVADYSSHSGFPIWEINRAAAIFADALAAAHDGFDRDRFIKNIYSDPTQPDDGDAKCNDALKATSNP